MIRSDLSRINGTPHGATNGAVAPPHSTMAEQRLLGTVFGDLQEGCPAFDVAAARLNSPEDFYHQKHRTIWDHICGLIERKKPVSLQTVAESLEQSGELEGIGDVGYLIELSDDAGSSHHADHWANIVRSKALRRRMIYTARAAEADAREIQDDDALAEKYPDFFPAPTIGRFVGMTSAELAALTDETEYLVENILVAGQPAILAGPQKSLKTSLAIDLAIALSTGGCFLGYFRVNRKCRVGVMSAESGMSTIRETAQRIAIAAHRTLEDCDGIFWEAGVPNLNKTSDLRDLELFVTRNRLDVLFLDPTYMMLEDIGSDAGNLFAVGKRLKALTQLIEKTGVTPIIAHHTKKNSNPADPLGPPELEHIAWAGFQEFARQWVLLNRRTLYQKGSGRHELWMTSGGSAGHSGLWALDISEGLADDPDGRHWSVRVLAPHDAIDAKETAKQAAQQQKQDDQRQADKAAILDAMRSYPAGETKTTIRDASGVRQQRFGPVFAGLIVNKVIEQVSIKKPNNRTYDGYRIVPLEHQDAF